MNDLTITDGGTLPALIDRATSALSGARNSAEVLEARDMARVAYDAAKSAGRMARAKAAHDEVIAAVYRAQADAAVIEARAKVRLADEYDAAQARGEVATGNRTQDFGVGDDNAKPATAADLGLRRDEIHEARQIRDAEAAAPGRIEAAASAIVGRGEEPTKAALRREIVGEKPKHPAAESESDPDAKARRELARLTPEALIDEVLGLRRQLSDLRVKRQGDKERIAELEGAIAALEADGDMGAKLSRAINDVRKANARLKETQAQLARETRRANAMEKARDDLRKRIEGQIIDMGAA